jgi:multidrug efflux pump subunit AcrA (membrane-fusion protein)
MKKTLITIIVLAAVVGGYMWVSKNARLEIGALMGETAKVRRGDLVVPINASGNIKPASVTQIKSKASGEVILLPFEVGAMVKKGELVVQLLDVDEKVNADRAQSDSERAEIALKNAEIALEMRQTVDVQTANANLEKAKAAKARADLLVKLKKELEDESPVDVRPREAMEVETAAREAAAAVAMAQADVNRAELNIKIAEQDIKTAAEAAKAAKRTFDDALQRLKETKVFSPIDGMVLSRNVQIGEVIQGGKTMFTGGTVLMEIADVGEIFAVVNVDEADIGQVRQIAPPSARPGASSQPATLPEGTIEAGEPVEVTVETFKEEKFEGVIERISPQSEIVAAIATFKVWIRITSENRDLLKSLLNTQAEAHFTARSVRGALLVNYDAIQKNPTGEDYGVYIPVDAPGQQRKDAKFVPCKFGVDNGIDVEVREGLKEGDVVYTKLPQKTQKEKDAEEKGES